MDRRIATFTIVFIVVVILAVLIVGLSKQLPANAHISTIEQSIFVQKDGKAIHRVKTQWSISEDKAMHGFFYKYEDQISEFDEALSMVESKKGKSPLVIEEKGWNKWFISIANGERISGPSSWSWTYSTDMVDAGHLGKTDLEGGEKRLVIDWTSSRYNERWGYDEPSEALKLRAVSFILPVLVSGEELSASDIALIPMGSKPFVSEENEIAYAGYKADDGSYRLSIRLTQKQPNTHRDQMVQIDFPIDYLNLDQAVIERLKPTL